MDAASIVNLNVVSSSNLTTLARRAIGISSCAVALTLSSSAAAGLFRAYVSVDGNDVNPCTVGAPCRLLPAALTAVNGGGEIWMLDSANFNTGPVSVNKSVTILAVPGAVGSIVANGGDAIEIPSVGVNVTLRNLVLLNFASGANGINMSGSGSLTVEECEVYGMPQDGVHVAASATTSVLLKNTTIRNVGGAAVSFAGTAGNPVNGTLDRVTMTSFNKGLNLVTNTIATVSNSVIAFGGTGVVIGENAGGASRVTVESSVIRATSIAVDAHPTSGNGQATLVRSTLANNPIGINAQGADTQVTLDSNVIQHSSTSAVNIAAGAVVYSRGNNTLTFGTTPFVVGGALTPAAGF